jgi:hypothetical protein
VSANCDLKYCDLKYCDLKHCDLKYKYTGEFTSKNPVLKKHYPTCRKKQIDIPTSTIRTLPSTQTPPQTLFKKVSEFYMKLSAMEGGGQRLEFVV